MKVLSIGTDRKLFEENSVVLSRSLEYAKKMEELHIIVFSLKNHNLKSRQIGNLYLYPTNSFSRWTYFLGAYSLGKKIIIENKFVRGLSVITAQDPSETGFVGWLLKTKFRLPLQLQIHTDSLDQHFKNSFLNHVRVILAKFLIPKADGLRVVSDKIASSLIKSFSNLKIKPTILPVFVDVSYIENTPITKDLKKEFPQFTFIIFMASRLTKEKKIDTALYALKDIVNNFPKTGLIIAGDGSEKNYLENLTKTLEISKNGIFIGWQNYLISYYKTANVFWLTSVYEGYGMTIIEAYSAGCPVVTTDVGIAHDLFIDGENAFICPIGDVGCFTRHTTELMTDGSKRELFKHKIKDSIKDTVISREEYVIRYVSLLEDLLKKNKFFDKNSAK